jgi:lipoate-protein ligase A
MTYLDVITDGALPGSVNMERDALLLARQRPGHGPVLRVYRWSPPAVTYGYHQAKAAFDREAISARGYDLVRRPTGGRAILHAEELTYAVVGASPSSLFGASLHETYAVINRALLSFLCKLGLTAEVSSGESAADRKSPVCFQSAGRYEIRVSGRKLIGSAQRRTGGVFLQHGSILTGAAHAGLAACLPPAARRGGMHERLEKETTNLARLTGRVMDESALALLGRDLVAAFSEAWRLTPRDVSYEETISR